jgi:hypothetical protein
MTADAQRAEIAGVAWMAAPGNDVARAGRA